MSNAWTDLPGATNGGVLLIADHASNRVPDDVPLGVDAAVLARHVAVDIGVAALARQLALPAVLGNVSRLVIDFNREEDAPGLIPETSDDVVLAANTGLGAAEREERIARWWRPYHAHIAGRIAAERPVMLVSLHSFTPQLASTPEAVRPWEVGVLYNQDDRAARIALPLLASAGIVVGDNLPYSGKLLNATMNRHGEANGLPYLGLEVRQDLITDEAGVARWADLLTPVIRATLAALA